MKNTRKALIAARKAIPGLTQEGIAKQIGIDRTSYLRIENGERCVFVEEAIAISKILGKQIEEIFLPDDVNSSHNATGTEGA